MPDSTRKPSVDCRAGRMSGVFNQKDTAIVAKFAQFKDVGRNCSDKMNDDDGLGS